MPTPKNPDKPNGSSFASRRAEREAREAAGEAPEPTSRPGGFRAGIDADNPTLHISHVQA